MRNAVKSTLAALILAAVLPASAQSLLDAVGRAPEPDPVLSGRKAALARPAPAVAVPAAGPEKASAPEPETPAVPEPEKAAAPEPQAPVPPEPEQPAAQEPELEQTAAPEPEKAAVPEPEKAAGEAVKSEAPAKKPAADGGIFGEMKPLTRDPVITAERTDYDRKNGIILFDRNVHVDAEEFQMHSDRIWVFVNGTNDLSRIVAIGNVSITNAAKTATCAKATYSREKSLIVMFAESDDEPACLSDRAGEGEMTVRGRKIAYNVATGVASVERPVMTAPAAMLNSKEARKHLQP